MSLEKKSHELKQIVATYETQWLLGDLSFLMRTGKDRANDQLGTLSSPEELERALGEFIDFYNNIRLHESINNLAPADVYFNRGAKILKQIEEIKQKTILQRRINHLLQIQNQSLSFV